MKVKMTIIGEVDNEKDYDAVKRTERHIDWTGIPENYPEFKNLHVEVEKLDESK